MPFFVTKKPSPWIIRSVGRPVVWVDPWVKLALVAASWTPRPTWIGLVPPRLALAADAPVSIWLRVSWNTVELDLNPVVLALAMLLPVTSSMVWLTRRPEMPAKSERSMVVSLRVGGGRRGGGRAVGDGQDRGDRDGVGCADVEHRTVGAEGDPADAAGLGGTVLVGPADGLADEAAGAER